MPHRKAWHASWMLMWGFILTQPSTTQPSEICPVSFYLRLLIITCTNTHTQTHTHTYTHKHIYTHTNTHKHMHTHKCTYMHTTYTYIICTCIHIHDIAYAHTVRVIVLIQTSQVYCLLSVYIGSYIAAPVTIQLLSNMQVQTVIHKQLFSQCLLLAIINVFHVTHAILVKCMD